MTELNLYFGGTGRRHPPAAPACHGSSFRNTPSTAPRRLAQAAVLMVLTVAITFTLINSAPGDMVDVIAGESSIADTAYN